MRQMKQQRQHVPTLGITLLFVLSGASMIGHGVRMLYQGVWYPGSSYSPTTFDLLFDCLPLRSLAHVFSPIHSQGSTNSITKHSPFPHKKPSDLSCLIVV
jgi:hypothetical protein